MVDKNAKIVYIARSLNDNQSFTRATCSLQGVNMGAIHAGMAGAAAGAANARRRHEAIGQAFENERDRQIAFQIEYLILNAGSGPMEWVLVVVFLMFGVSAMMYQIGAFLAGDNGGMIGMIVGLFGGIGLGAYLEQLIFSRPSQRKLEAYIASNPRHAEIQEGVQEIMSRF